MKGTTLYVLMLGNIKEDGNYSDFDVYGLYSSEELAEGVIKSLRRKEGGYNGISEGYVYNRACIMTRIVDNNFPD